MNYTLYFPIKFNDLLVDATQPCDLLVYSSIYQKKEFWFIHQ